MARVLVKPLIPHIVLWCAAAVLIVGIFVLASSEQKKTRDIVRMQEVLSIRSALQGYYIDHAAYPASPNGTIQIGDGDHESLCEGGFVARNSDTCGKRTYERTLPSGEHSQGRDTYAYTPLGDNGTDPCTSPAACPHFAIQFTQETNVLYAKGSHTLTDQGVK